MMKLKQTVMGRGRSVGLGGRVPDRITSLAPIRVKESRACRIIAKSLPKSFFPLGSGGNVRFRYAAKEMKRLKMCVQDSKILSCWPNYILWYPLSYSGNA